ncbi:MAG TPA: serine/threonine-protein kinase, partial [Vicinamibacterales bacterium]|nr:serine/threonine-protein kinase [Vicinamibacterales bacterium]
MTPAFLGHYRVDSPLGRGGMGEVFRAFDMRLGRPVAVKLMANPAERSAAIQRFVREARAASALNHPNIVTIHDVGETDEGHHYIVQEFIDGRTLRSLLVDAVTTATVVDIGRQVARALSAAHAAGIVHRDVKPENIMVRGDGYVKVLDFGLARIDTSNASDETTRTNFDTAVGTVMGTTCYLSPEVVQARVAGPPADVFALGVVLYELLAGRRPFVAPTSVGVLSAILSEEPVPVSRLNPAVPVVLDELVQRMLAKDPARRPTATDVDDLLARLQGHDAPANAPAGASPTNTVGRSDERAALRRAFMRAKDGRSVVVAVTGESGIGKSSLTDDFLSEVAASGERPIVARGRCSERLAGSEAYLPILEALDHLLRRGSGVSVETVMKTVAPTWYMQVATASDHPSIVDLRTDAPAVSQERMKREIGALLQDLSRTRPLVLFLDDLHWADISTIDILNYVAGRFADMHVLILVTYRPSEMALAQNQFTHVAAELRSRGLFE